MSKLTPKETIDNPSGSLQDFPLFRHGRGYWAKKVKGKTLYFGKIAADPDGKQAVARWLAQEDDLLAGKNPPPVAKAGSKSKAAKKTKKPRPDFPLYAHPKGYWAKKVCQKVYYFGKVADDPKGEKAFNQWVDEKDSLLAGRGRPRRGPDGAVTVKDVVNQFIAHKLSLLNAQEITQRTYDEYLATGKRLAAQFGRLTPIDTLIADDFRKLRASIAKEWGPVRLGNEIQRVRSIFKYGYDSGIINTPPRFGADFKKPSAKVLRKNRSDRGLCMFERDELLAVIESASVNGKAMILLGVNGGMGNGDVGSVPIEAIDLARKWLVYPRPKTGIERRIPLWPETIAALKAARDFRPTPNDAAESHLFFMGPRGRGYADTRGYRVAWEMTEAIANATIKDEHGKAKPVERKGLSFYALRHTFQTVAEGARDLAAVQSIMGHAASGNDMSATYRERVDDERLQTVVDHVRKWLFKVEVEEAKK